MIKNGYEKGYKYLKNVMLREATKKFRWPLSSRGGGLSGRTTIGGTLFSVSLTDRRTSGHGFHKNT